MKNLLLTAMLLFSFIASHGQCTTVYTVGGGGAWCGSGPYPAITLSGSDTGVMYELYLSSGAWVTPLDTLPGTGSALSFSGGLYFAPFFIRAMRGTCILNMADSVTSATGVPSPIFGSSTVCVGGTGYVYDSVDGGIWSSSNTAIASVDTTGRGGYSSSANVRGISAGTAVITYSFTSSCGTNIETFPVTVSTPSASPVVTGASSVCLTASSTYSCSVAGGRWSCSPTAIGTINYSTGVFTATGLGTVTITYRVFAGCGYVSDTINVTVTPVSAPAIISGPFAIPFGSTVAYTASGGYGGTWSTSTTSVATVSTSGVVNPVGLGTTYLRYDYTTSGCGAVYTNTMIDVITTAALISDSFYVTRANDCGGAQFNITASGSATGLRIATLYGDGTHDTTAMGFTYMGHPRDTFSHYYSASGTYTVTHYLLSGTTALDSLSYAYTPVLCTNLSLTTYYDVDSSCSYNASTDYINGIPLTFTVDSNGVRIDTVTLTTGMYYLEHGAAGDVYSFTNITSGINVSCPSSGIITDTVTSTWAARIIKAIPLSWTISSGSSYDLSLYSSGRNAGRHHISGGISVTNAIAATGALITLNFDSRYAFQWGSPAPTSVSGHTATWVIGTVVPGATPVNINYSLEVPGTYSTWLTPGDTVSTTISVIPTSGDADTTDNYIYVVDTVRSSYDPNSTAVSPEGDILNGTKLHYTVNFENDGNDTAQNIYVLDTLSDNVDPSTLTIAMATAPMYISYLHYGTHTVVKFDFPNIKLPDSSHHGLCTGAVMFNVKARTGLADGTTIPNGAGIYFDDNEVILTNTVINTIVVPAVAITSSAGSTICAGDTIAFTAAPHSIANRHFQWFVNSTATGTDSVAFASHTLTTGDVVRCRMTSIQDDTVYANSNTITNTITPLPNAGTITGVANICLGASATLINTVTGGAWSSSNLSVATVSGGVVTGLSPGLAYIFYTVTNACGSASDTQLIRIDTTLHAGVISGADSLCPAGSIALTTTGYGGAWSVSNGNASVSYGTVTGITAGTDTVIYAVSNVCGSFSTIKVVTINAVITPFVSITVTPGGAVCSGTAVTFTATAVNGGSAPAYDWKRFGASTGATGATYTYTPSLSDVITCDMSSSLPCPTSATVASSGITMVVNPSVTPSIVITSSLDSVAIAGSPVSFYASATYGGSATTYQWHVNGAAVPGATSSTFSTSVYHNTTVYCVMTGNAPCATTTGATSNTKIIYADYLSVSSITATISGLTLFPNPNNGVFELAGTVNTLSDEPLYLEVSDITGRVLYTGHITPATGKISGHIALGNNIPAGAYYLRLTGGNDAAVVRFTVQ